ncbi:MAG: hypothetical protein DMG22_00185 [Acidobacteria bacterium]|nr:MAG: hypothetical protein DMG22_00185 [Acidobacteriota bacterium]
MVLCSRDQRNAASLSQAPRRPEARVTWWSRVGDANLGGDADQPDICQLWIIPNRFRTDDWDTRLGAAFEATFASSFRNDYQVIERAGRRDHGNTSYPGYYNSLGTTATAKTNESPSRKNQGGVAYSLIARICNGRAC